MKKKPHEKKMSHGLALAALLTAGCITNETTHYRDAERMKVSFENDAAGRLFYETLNRPGGSTSRTESKTEVSIPIIFEHKERTVDGENTGFNSAVRRCDTNGDGKITEAEARIFSQSAVK